MPSQIDELSRVITEAIARAITSGQIEASLPEAIPLERPKNRDHGDYATSIALQLAKAAGKNPREVALILQKHIGTTPLISAVDIAGPGFLNFTLNRASQANLVNSIIESGAKYGQGNSLSGVRINLEFISANPTGPLHLGHTRWAAVGDALGRVLSAAGADISREFYINDRGNQMDLFGASLEAAALGKPIPEDGYQGNYIHDLALEVVGANNGIKDLPEPARLVEFRERGYQLQLNQQKKVLDTFGTHFDTWFSERSLHDAGSVEHGIDVLRKQGHVFELDNATWLRTTDFGDDKDRVLTKSDGSLTYFSSDTAYY
ncbi:MAG: arginine--tRNA ligase, partial [Actinobacteria bacterium]|nr:arginine--tRNA ligase [Actinomycetota bacterium]